MKSKETVIFSDLEGPWSLADHAYECMKLAPGGDRLYKKLSAYDDYLYFVRKKTGYEPGSTLSLILPFLVANNIKEADIKRVAGQNTATIGKASEAVKILSDLGYRIYIASTSYHQYVDCKSGILGIPHCRTFSTYFPIDSFSGIVKKSDKEWAKEWAEKILGLPDFTVTESTREEDLNEDEIYTLDILDDFFWNELPKSSFQSPMESISTIGGKKKNDALMSVMEYEGKDYENMMVIGDSITDSHMLRETRKNGGLSVSFNGNGFCLKEADIAVISENAAPTAVICDIYENAGRDDLESVIGNWGIETIIEATDQGMLNSRIFGLIAEESAKSGHFPSVFLLDDLGPGFGRILDESIAMRKRLRGEAGYLG